MLKKLMLGISALALVQATSAQALQDSKTCMPRENFESMVVAILPTAITSLQDRCRTSLPANSALLTTDISKGSTIDVASDAAWPKAASSIQKMINNEMTDGADIEVLQMFSKLMVSTMVKQEVKTEDCHDVENIYSPVAILPPQNLAAFTSALIILGLKDDMQSKKLPQGSVCF